MCFWTAATNGQWHGEHSSAAVNADKLAVEEYHGHGGQGWAKRVGNTGQALDFIR